MVQEDAFLMRWMIWIEFCKPPSHVDNWRMPIAWMPALAGGAEALGADVFSGDAFAHYLEHAQGIGDAVLEDALYRGTGRHLPSLGEINRAVVDLFVNFMHRYAVMRAEAAIDYRLTPYAPTTAVFWWRRMDINRPIARLLQMTRLENDATEVGNNEVVISIRNLRQYLRLGCRIAHFPEQHGRPGEVPLRNSGRFRLGTWHRRQQQQAIIVIQGRDLC